VTAINDYGSPVLCSRQVGYTNYVDVTGTYTYRPWRTSLTLGVTDLGDAGARFMASAALFGAQGYPTDPAIYDIAGRSFFARVKVAFK
jgi:hypothetical protein